MVTHKPLYEQLYCSKYNCYFNKLFIPDIPPDTSVVIPPIICLNQEFAFINA